MPVVILPISVINEVRNLPENKASFEKGIKEMFAHRWTGVGENPPEVLLAVQNDLTRHIAKASDGLQEEARHALDTEFGACNDWTIHNLYNRLVRVFAQLTGRVFVGRPLSREKEWIHSSVEYSIDAVEALKAFWLLPQWLRHVVGPFLPPTKRVNCHYNAGAQLLKPIIDACLSKEENEKLFVDDSEDEQGTMISWILKRLGPGKSIDPQTMALRQMNCKPGRRSKPIAKLELTSRSSIFCSYRCYNEDSLRGHF